MDIPKCIRVEMWRVSWEATVCDYVRGTSCETVIIIIIMNIELFCLLFLYVMLSRSLTWVVNSPCWFPFLSCHCCYTVLYATQGARSVAMTTESIVGVCVRGGGVGGGGSWKWMCLWCCLAD